MKPGQSGSGRKAEATANPPPVMKSASVVGGFTGLSRLAGFLREIIMAYFFGTSLAKSAFDFAFKIPNLFRRLFGEGALSAAFVPIFTETLRSKGHDEANRLAGRMMTMLGAALSVITGVVVLGAVLLARAVPEGSTAGAILPLLAIMFPYMLMICLVALCMAILNSFHKFAVPAFTPVLLNVIWIASIFFLRPFFGNSPGEQIYGVAWGILAAGAVQLAIQFPALRRSGITPRISFCWSDPRIKRVLMLMGPAALGMGIHQVNALVDGLLAFWVGDWAPATLTYAERLIYLPLGVFATAIGTVLLPTFSHHAASNAKPEIFRTIRSAIKNMLIIMTPAAIGLMVLAAPAVSFVYEWKLGRFDANSALLTSRALFFYAPGLIVFSLYKVLAPAFFALKDTSTPVKIGVSSVILNFLLNVTFVITWPEGYKHAGLACATVLASLFTCIALAVVFSRRLGSPGWRSIGVSAIKVSICGAAMYASLVVALRVLPGLLAHVEAGAKLGQALLLFGSGFAGLAMYSILAILLCRTEISDILTEIRGH